MKRFTMRNRPIKSKKKPTYTMKRTKGGYFPTTTMPMMGSMPMMPMMPVPWRPAHNDLLCRSSRLAVNPPTPTSCRIHSEKIRADIAPKTVQRCGAKRSV